MARCPNCRTDIRSRRAVLALLFDGELAALASGRFLTTRRHTIEARENNNIQANDLRRRVFGAENNVPRAIARRRHTIQAEQNNIFANNINGNQRNHQQVVRFQFTRNVCVVCRRLFVTHNDEITCTQKCARFFL